MNDDESINDLPNLLRMVLIGVGATAAGYWGDYKCDVPLWTIEDLLQKLANKSDEVL